MSLTSLGSEKNTICQAHEGVYLHTSSFQAISKLVRLEQQT
jgi:hypothetical protein